MSRFTQPSRRVLLVLVVGLVLALTTATAVLATVTAKNGGALAAVRTKTSNESALTTSTSWSDVPGMSTFMTVPAGEQALAIVTFSGQSACTSTAANPSVFCFVRVLLDGSPASPGGVVFDSAPDGNSAFAVEANSMQWVAGPMGAGQHLIRVQYKVDEGNSEFDLFARTLTVLQSKV